MYKSITLCTDRINFVCTVLRTSATVELYLTYEYIDRLLIKLLIDDDRPRSSGSSALRYRTLELYWYLCTEYVPVIKWSVGRHHSIHVHLDHLHTSIS